MTVSIRIVKGRTTSVSLPGRTIETAELLGSGFRLLLEHELDSVIITEEQTLEIPVPRRVNAVFDCVLLLNGTDEIPCGVVANPERPNL